jgi:hypothetical protein
MPEDYKNDTVKRSFNLEVMPILSRHSQVFHHLAPGQVVYRASIGCETWHIHSDGDWVKGQSKIVDIDLLWDNLDQAFQLELGHLKTLENIKLTDEGTLQTIDDYDLYHYGKNLGIGHNIGLTLVFLEHKEYLDSRIRYYLSKVGVLLAMHSPNKPEFENYVSTYLGEKF